MQAELSQPKKYCQMELARLSLSVSAISWCEALATNLLKIDSNKFYLFRIVDKKEEKSK